MSTTGGRRLRKDGQPWGLMWDQWLPEHDAWLRERAGTAAIADLAVQISERFEITRSPVSLRIRAKVLSISLWRRGYSMRDLERIFGVGHRAIVHFWITPGLLPAERWQARGPYAGWLFQHDDVVRFVRERGYAYDWQRMEQGHPLRSLAEVQARRDPWVTADDLARYLGMNRSNLKRWLRRGLIPHERRVTNNNSGRIMVRAALLLDIRDVIRRAQREGIERSRAAFTARRRGQAA